MSTPSPPRVFISYSHDSRKHEKRVLALSNRLRHDGVDAKLDQYESSPENGWPLWMENQVQDSNFVILVCSAVYLRRIQHREEADTGHGVVWEGTIIYNLLYGVKVESRKFIPVLFSDASVDDIPLPLRGFTRYHLAGDYEKLYHRLTNKLPSKPPLGSLESLPAKEKSPDSLPNAFTLKQLSKTKSNPHYAFDIFRLDRIYDHSSVLNKETVIIVVGTSIVAELLDRPAAQLLRDKIDQKGAPYAFRRGIVITHEAWYAEIAVIGNNPVIAVGGPANNRLSEEFAQWKPAPPSKEGVYPIPVAGPRIGTGFFRFNSGHLPQVGLWGETASATRETVEHYFKNQRGFAEFLNLCWK
jgi:hypothetical protein